jgi:hypothetical protein
VKCEEGEEEEEGLETVPYCATTAQGETGSMAAALGLGEIEVKKGGGLVVYVPGSQQISLVFVVLACFSQVRRDMKEREREREKCDGEGEEERRSGPARLVTDTDMDPCSDAVTPGQVRPSQAHDG